METISEAKSQPLQQLAQSTQDPVQRGHVPSFCPTQNQAEKAKYAPQAKCISPQMANFKYLKVCHTEEISEFPKSVILRRDSSQLEISLKQAVILFSSRNLMILKVTVVEKDYVKISSCESFKI